MGYKGAGKSSAGNTILGRDEFDLKRSAQCVRRHGEVADRHITAIEAPGWWRNHTVEKSPERLKQEILLSVSLCPPGPHAVLLIIDVDTRHIESEGQDLQQLVDKCGNRYHVLNNHNRSDDTQIKELLEKIEETVAENNGCHFEIDRKILQEMKERRRTEEERAEERMKRMQKKRENIRSQMMRGVGKLDTWSVGSSGYGSFGSHSGESIRSDSPFSSVDSSDLQKRCNSMGLPSPYMSGDERSDTMSVRSSAYSSDMAESEEDCS
ncbi:GTPase IMAP family member 2 [Anabarilius grahami]|uniref:GTPase IMAP family member 2 n=1 Tax=Anabarilius grahami TaxID=495550 RepID=A0A3N0Z879_ANAGA|nr:GTPase IMAP family member 2 [Anabarilius grahami]